MSSSMKALDPAFQGVGQKAYPETKYSLCPVQAVPFAIHFLKEYGQPAWDRGGIDIWRIENFQPLPLPKSDYGKFHVGDSYIVLWTSAGKGGSFFYDIHFWIGKETSQDEAGTAAIKTVELDMAMGGRAVQHRELQGHESDKFLSYFKPCIIPLEGGVASGFREVEKEEFETRLYVCKGKRVVRLKQVPFARSSLNHDDIFILDTENKIFQFNGENSNIQERAKALEVIQYLKEQYHDGTCNVAVVDDGKLDTESDSGEFWVVFGGFAPLGRKVVSEDDVTPDKIPPKLYCISDRGEAMPLEGQLSKAMLENSKCYLLDCGDEVFVWVGRATQLQERKVAGQVAEEFVGSHNRPKSTRTTRITQGYETRSFKSYFDSWPAGSATPAAAEGRGRVAALLKQQGMDAKGSKSIPVNEEVPPLLEGGGKMEVWYIDGSVKCPLPKEDVGKFHTGDCYIALYSYHAGDRKEEFLCCWIGKKSQEEDQKTAVELADKMFNSLKGRPVQGRIFEGKEPPQFTALFQPMVVLKGGMSSGYKNELVEKGLTNESYDPNKVALFRLSGTSDFNNKAIQVDAVATSLNSMECFVLQSESTMFSWNGNKSTFEQQQLGDKIAGFLKPGGPIKHFKEGTESSAFWSALGGKESYTSERASVDVVREPHLFTFSLNKEKFEFEEIYNFCQDDLLPEDTLILDTHAEVFVWVGQCVDVKEKQHAFEIGQKYLESAASLEGLPPDVPLYKVPEGSEPCFFTTFFQWDHTKAVVHGNSFQKKAALLFGASHGIEDMSSRNHGPRQRAEALAALTSAFNSSSSSKDQPSTPPKASGQGSQRAAAVAALSSVLSAEAQKVTPDDSPGRSNTGTPLESSPRDHSTEEVVGSGGEEADAEAKEGADQDDFAHKIGHITFSYEQLKVHSENPATEIDFKQREAYMENEEFEAVMGVTKEAFYGMPKWKQDAQKKKVDLF